MYITFSSSSSSVSQSSHNRISLKHTGSMSYSTLQECCPICQPSSGFLHGSYKVWSGALGHFPLHEGPDVCTAHMPLPIVMAASIRDHDVARLHLELHFLQLGRSGDLSISKHFQLMQQQSKVQLGTGGQEAVLPASSVPFTIYSHLKNQNRFWLETSAHSMRELLLPSMTFVSPSNSEPLQVTTPPDPSATRPPTDQG